MDELRERLKRAGWRSSDRYKGFVQTRRAGIDFHLGPLPPASSFPPAAERLELRYVYQTERTRAEGTIDLPGPAAIITPAQIGDAMTSLYLRVHERPDPSRTLGGSGARGSSSKSASSSAPSPPSPGDENNGDDGQTTLLF